jgi:hypothetical protein
MGLGIGIGVWWPIRTGPVTPSGCLTWETTSTRWELETSEWQCVPVWNSEETKWEAMSSEWQFFTQWNTANTLWENKLNKWDQ